MQKQPDDPGDDDAMRRVLAGEKPGVHPAIFFWALVMVCAVAAIFFLSGCGTYNGYQPDVLINGYDPTLTSHQEALGLREPRYE